jgi:hypothetical protein
MGTNYYHVKTCLCCGHEERVHIGKSSFGWTFALRVFRGVVPDEPMIPDWEVWKAHLRTFTNWHVEDEYGDPIDTEDFFKIVEDRKGYTLEERPVVLHSPGSRTAILDPGGLLRRKIDGVWCVGHGEGSWDYIVGDFS